jgi:hypothetical protein
VPSEPVTGGYVVGPGEGVPDQGLDVKASRRSTGGSLTLIEAAIDGGPPRHTHTRGVRHRAVLIGRSGARFNPGARPVAVVAQ